MALVACPDCAKEISESAPTCPHCGRPMSSAVRPVSSEGRQKSSEVHPPPPRGGISPAVIVLLIILGLFGLFGILGIGAGKAAFEKTRASARAEADRVLGEIRVGAKAAAARGEICPSSTVPVPATVPTEKTKVSVTLWGAAPWECLRVSVNEPQFCQYSFLSSGMAGVGDWTATAVCNPANDPTPIVVTASGHVP